MQIENAAKAEKETGRVEAFSDGVFAFAITVLVLDLKVPIPQESAAGLLQSLLSQWPMFLAFFISFGTILIMWINHHRLFTLIKRSSHWLLVFNGLLLLSVTVVPFTTEMVASYYSANNFDKNMAAMVYCGVFIVISIFFNMLWWYALSKKLLDDLADPTASQRITRQYLVGPVLYLAALLLAIFSVPLSLALNLLLAVYFALPNPAVDAMLGIGQNVDG